ncbi:hypothetical protein [uncultured Tateyamaria sp.]|uniref:hypothetical protein n=1 Tax=Tateyamaria sp. 1078 TaxID=3417464 RepID=UPI00261CDD2C|nr:hypothetical protein [uncultured Tateyamaria sp.]
MTLAAPIEDFLEAITAQLDKTQDALRLKAVNRPLTFALKDFAIDLSVFVEMDQDGVVRLRPSAPNEEGASQIHLGFATITRAMIEENTISMELTQAPTLEEAGLAPEETVRLQRLGVRNTAQLNRLNQRSGQDGISRFSGVDPNRLQEALKLSRPRINYVNIGPGAPVPVDPDATENMVPIRQKQRQMRLRGAGLVDPQRPVQARLNNRMVPIRAASASHIDLELPEDENTGALELSLPDGSLQRIDLVPEEAEGWDAPAPDEPEGSDP